MIHCDQSVVTADSPCEHDWLLVTCYSTDAFGVSQLCVHTWPCG